MDINALKRKFKMDNHHAIERFGILFSAFVVGMTSVFALAVKQEKDRQKYVMTEASVITTNAVPWSQIGTSMQITGMYRNAADTRCVVWLKVADMAMLSPDPGAYEVFITTMKGMKLTHPISGSLYVYGDTGNMALLLNDTQGFENVVMEVVMRSDPIYLPDKLPENAYGYDESFVNYNQAQFFINCAGTSSKVLDCLDDEVISARDLYYEGALSQQIHEAQESLQLQLDKLRDDALRVSTYASTLEQYKFFVPTLPAMIATDTVSNNVMDSINQPLEFDPSMFDLDTAVIKSNHGQSYLDEGETAGNAAFDKNADYYYVTDFVYPGGLNINIDNVDSLEDLFNTLKPESMNYEEWRDAKRKEYNDYARFTNYTINNSDWIRDSKKYTYGADDMYKTAIDKYTASVTEFIDDKCLYQTSSIYQLFDYISELDNVADNVRVNTDNALITVWQRYN